ncbi:MAG: hypothetical protein IAB99_07225 [Bacteroidetes bacterium]|uniref:Uncharacterized protein n=1 Tax=Candidatus Cryptobacteroides faecipullorum TaxID=2840764 RepID=A0A9D9NBU7_9BACT|nr:hypothetical protein [Candidatus Cryptobacteroides faecipullorum]
MDRTYVFNSDGNNGGTCAYPAMPFMPAGYGNGFGGYGNDGLWGVIYLAIIASIFGWGGNGFGFGGRSGFGGSIPAELSGNAGRELLMQAIQGNREAVGQIASTLSCSTQQVQSALGNIQSQLGLSGQQIINAIQSGDAGIASQISSCCCNILQSIERTSAAQQLQSCQNVNTLTNTMTVNARDLKDSNDANARAIIAKIDASETRVLQDKLDAERQKSASLAAQLNNEHQTQAIMGNVAQQLAPVVAGLNALQSDVDGIKCKLPNTVPVQYPQIVGVNLDAYRSAAFGAAAGSYAGAGCGCAYGTNGYWY